jgi:glycosyltransferase involved in cell wall biosynthesis
MRILAVQPFLRGYTIRPSAGGKSKAALRLAQYLVGEGHQVFVLPWEERLLDEVTFRLDEEGACAVALPSLVASSARSVLLSLAGLRHAWRDAGSLSRGADEWLRESLLRRDIALDMAMRRVEPDVVHVHHTVCDFAACYRRLGFSAPLVLSHTHNVGSHLDAYAQIVFSSRHQEATVLRARPDCRGRTRLVYCPVDEDYRGREVSRGGGGVLFVGMLENERKGLDILLEAVRSGRGGGRWPVTVVGEGRFRPVHEETARRHGLDAAFLGRVSNRECARRMAEADVFCMPSRQEAFGIVYAEALSMGLPIIGYPPTVRELAELLRMDVGLPFDAEAGGPDELAALIERIMTGDTYGPTARRELAERARRHFSLEAFGSQYVKCYEDVIAGRRGRAARPAREEA